MRRLSARFKPRLLNTSVVLAGGRSCRTVVVSSALYTQTTLRIAPSQSCCRSLVVTGALNARAVAAGWSRRCAVAAGIAFNARMTHCRTERCCLRAVRVGSALHTGTCGRIANRPVGIAHAIRMGRALATTAGCGIANRPSISGAACVGTTIGVTLVIGCAGARRATVRVRQTLDAITGLKITCRR